MIIESQARNARQVDDGIWRAELTPLELQFIDPQEVTEADMSVVLCGEPPEFDAEQRTLRIQWGKARVLVIGETDRVVVVHGGGPRRSASSRERGNVFTS